MFLSHAAITIDGNPADWNLSDFTTTVRAGQGGTGDIALVGYDAGTLYYSGYYTGATLPVNAADHAYLSFEQTALPVAMERGVGVQAMKVFGKAHLLRSLNPTECLRYALSQPGVHVAICGAGTQGQMEDNIRAVRNFRRMTPDEIADVRERAVVGAGVHSGPTLEYWKRR